jgi:hypothetical protein
MTVLARGILVEAGQPAARERRRTDQTLPGVNT